MLKNETYGKILMEFREHLDISDANYNILENFVGKMYGYKDKGITRMRYKLYFSTHGRCEATKIPSYSDSLKLHTSRACFQIHIWTNHLEFHLTYCRLRIWLDIR